LMMKNIDEVTDKWVEALEAIEKDKGELLDHTTRSFGS
jgi:hypothetical protein